MTVSNTATFRRGGRPVLAGALSCLLLAGPAMAQSSTTGESATLVGRKAGSDKTENGLREVCKDMPHLPQCNPQFRLGAPAGTNDGIRPPPPKLPPDAPMPRRGG